MGDKIIVKDNQWTFDYLEKIWVEIERVAKDYLKLDMYSNQIEIVTSEQMLDAYSLIGLPISYPHWKFGKDFMSNRYDYLKGYQGLAYELVINSNPCISYNMEDNSAVMQALVLAHAACGHNSFFKNNYLFKQWTDASSIIDYMVFAKNYVTFCEEKYGADLVETILDACHALMDYGIDSYKKPAKLSLQKEEARLKKIQDVEEENVNDIWRTVPTFDMNPKDEFDTNPPVKFPAEPEENILYFIEKNAPNLEPWKKELIRIVRKTAQYFSPQGQTKVMNEGWATMSHYLIINKLYEEKIVDDGFMIEFLKSHTNVISQPEFDSPYYSGINPYTLGFNIFMDIKRICEDPTEEDKKWFPNLIGKDWLEEAHYAMKNFKDDSFILQYLSPKVIRDMKLFLLSDDSEDENYHINAIHNERGYEKIREKLSTQYSRSRYIPNIQITHVDKYKTRRMSLSYYVKDGKKLLSSEAEQTVNYLQYLWEFPVRLYEQHEDGKKKIIAKAE